MGGDVESHPAPNGWAKALEVEAINYLSSAQAPFRFDLNMGGGGQIAGWDMWVLNYLNECDRNVYRYMWIDEKNKSKNGVKKRSQSMW